MSDLPTATLGRTGLEVTKLGYGAMELRGGERARRDVDAGTAGEILNAVLDAGINFIDTSPDYGVSEELIGEHISQRRDEYFLASKCGCPVNQPPPAEGQRPAHVFTPENIRAAVEQSLRRMRTDHLDLVQFHISPSRDTLEENGAVDALAELRDEGKTRFIGMSGTLPNLIDHIDMGVFDAFQIPYSALEREHEDAIRDAAVAGSGTIIRGGVARGAPVGRRRDARELSRLLPADGRGAPRSVGAGRSRRPARRHDAHGVHAAVHAQPSRHAHHDRRHREPRSTSPTTSPSRRRARSRPTSTKPRSNASPDNELASTDVV